MSDAALAIFDIDGTLLKSARLDEECWCEAVRLTFGIDGVDTDWGAYEHSTDRAILDEVLRTHLGRRMTDDDERTMLDRFVALLTERVKRDRADVAPTLGAADALAALRDLGWRVAIGTGGWRRSAQLKLGWAGLRTDGIPAAFAEDGPERERIILTAQRRALPEGLTMRRFVYLGDGRWDAKAAASVGAAFIGVGTEETAEKLRRAGASVVLADFRDVGALVEALESATVPKAKVSADGA